MDALGMAIVSEGSHEVDYAFSALEEGTEEIVKQAERLFEKYRYNGSTFQFDYEEYAEGYAEERKQEEGNRT